MSESPRNIIDNKRIAKNTLFMYLRTLCIMLISLYTSRVVLRVLGAEDFGIYNIVGGVVVMFSFLNGAMTSATQRYLSFELGKQESERNVPQLFSACINVHLILAFIVVILAETIGLWFLNSKMNFPAERMAAVNFVYQFSILTCAVNIIKIPFSASVISHEGFSFYAYVGIIEAALKLGIVFLLLIIMADKLELYSVLTFSVAIFILICFCLYIKFSISDSYYCKVKEPSIYKQLISFSGWTVLGSFANMSRHSGVSIVNNIYYGVTVNAAIGIAQQVNGALDQFVSGFQQAFNPQLTKSQAAGEKENQHKLICRTSKISFFILLLFSCPLLANLDYVLHLWLGEFPQYTKEICECILIASLIECVSGPLWVAIFSQGNIKTYQIVLSVVLLLNIPIAILCGHLNLDPQWVYAGCCIINIILLCVRLYFTHRTVGLSIRRFCYETILPIAVVSAIAIVISFQMMACVNHATSFWGLVWQSSAIIILLSITIYLIGFDKSERLSIRRLVLSRINI